MPSHVDLSTLADALPRAEFVEHHTRVVDSAPQHVWDALHETRWSDLTVTKLFILVRGLGGRPDQRAPRILDAQGPVRLVTSREPAYVAGGRIARPWKLRPERGPDVDTLDELAAFAAPGWLKYGMDFELLDLGDGRTRLTTATLCQPTDASARRAFGRYWRVIGPFSGLIRVDLLRAVARRAKTMASAAEKAAIA